MTEFNKDAHKKAHDALIAMTKEAFAPPPPPTPPAAPMPPAAPAAPAGAAAGPPPAAQMPMDPAMMGGGMPMDPAMAGGMPMDPAMMDPAMMGGAPPAEGAPPEGGEGGTPLTVTLEDLMALFEQVAATTGGGDGAPNESSPNVSKALDKISERLDTIEGQLGGGGAGGAPEDAGIEELLGSVGGAGGGAPGMAEMGAGAPPFSPAEPLPPMPEAMIASASEVIGQVKSAKKIGDILAGLRKK